MINLKKDLFVRLVICAQKDRSLNKPFLVNHVELSRLLHPKVVHTISDPQLSESEMELAVEKVVSKDGKIVPKVTVQRQNTQPKRIEDKIDDIVNDPIVSEIRIELEFAETLLKKIKIADPKNPKISVIEGTVLRLKTLLEQKTYI